MIYAFRGATVRNILDFPAAFRAAGAGGDAGAQYRSPSPSSTPPMR